MICQASYDLKKRLTIGSFALWMFLGGVEYSIIIPTVLFYLQDFDISFWFIGAVIAAYSLSAGLLSPGVGFLMDKYRKTRLFTILSACFLVLGNSLYALNFDKLWPLVGRTVAGIGGSFIGALNGEVGRITTKEERTAWFSVTEGARLFGLIIGPAFNLILGKWSFRVGELGVNFKNAPGILLAVCWTLFALAAPFMVHDLSSQEEYLHYKKVCSEEKEKEEEEKEEDRKELEGMNTQKDSNDLSCLEAINELKSPPNLLLIWVQFYALFCVLSLDAACPIFARIYLKWDVTTVNILYLCAGIMMVVSVVGVSVVSRYCQDRALIVWALVVQAIGHTLLIFLSFNFSIPIDVALIIGLWVYAVLSVPCILISGRALLTKLTRDKVQGFVQGVLMSASMIASVLGPIFSTFFVENIIVVGLSYSVFNIITNAVFLYQFKQYNSNKDSTINKESLDVKPK